MAMSNINSRLARLEQAYTPDKLLVILKRFTDGLLVGYDFVQEPRTRIQRLPDETDDILLDRARKAVIAAYPRQYAVTLAEVRE